MPDERVNIWVKIREAREFSRDAKRVARDTDEIGDSARRTGEQFDASSKAGEVFRRVTGLMKPAALIASLGLLTQVAAASAAGVVALTAALAPAGGAIAAYPVAALAAAQGLGVFKLATTGLSDAIGGLGDKLDEKKLAKLTPEAQGFARVIQGVKPQIVSLQRSLQGGLFGGLTKGLRSALPAFDAIKPGLVGTSRVLGDLGARAGRLVGSKGFLRDLGSQARFNNKLLTLMGDAGLHVVNALRHVMVAARPLTLWLTRMADGWAAAADGAAENGRKTGKLAAFFNRTRVVLTHLFSIVGALATAFKNVVSAAFPLGHDLLVSLDKGAEAMARWTGSAKGKNSIAKFFADAKEPIYAVGRLIRQVLVSFGGMASGKGVAPLIDKLTALVPVIADVVKNTTRAFGPAMIEMISAFAQAFAPFAGSSGPLVLFAKGLAGIARGMAWLERKVPGVTTIMTAFVGALAVIKAIGIASFASQMFGFSRGLTAVKTAMTAVKDACILTRIQLAALWVQTKLAAAGTKLMAGAQWLLNAAMRANPIGIVITGMVALGAAFVVAYRKVGWFHRAVDSVFSWIKGHWPLLVGILTGPIGLAVVGIIKNFDRIVGFFKRMPGRIAKATVGMFDGIKDAFRSAINWIIGKWNGLNFHIGGTDLGPLGHLPDINIGTPDIPLLAGGGRVMGVGRQWISGEAGPEIGTVVPGGVSVRPLQVPSVRGAVAAVAGNAPRDDRPVVINVQVDRKTLTRVFLDGIHDATARA